MMRVDRARSLTAILSDLTLHLLYRRDLSQRPLSPRVLGKLLQDLLSI